MLHALATAAPAAEVAVEVEAVALPAEAEVTVSNLAAQYKEKPLSSDRGFMIGMASVSKGALIV